MSPLLMASDWLAQSPIPPAKPCPEHWAPARRCSRLREDHLLLPGRRRPARCGGHAGRGLRGRSDTAKNALTHLPYVYSVS